MVAAAAHVDDFVVVGGGLAGSLVALSLLHHRPHASFSLVEARPRTPGHHTWSFHAADLPDSARVYVDPIVSARWPSYDVAFEGRARTLASPYATILSDDLDDAVARVLSAAPLARRIEARAVEIGATEVVLDSGQHLSAKRVIDARGPSAHANQGGGGFQKFVGLELSLARPAPRATPLLMDARVPQRDGFRFVYVLPFSPTRVLIEDTYFSDGQALDVPAVRAEVLSYAAAHGYEIDHVIREEVGVLPLPTRLSVARHREGPLRVGFAGGLFHPTTGYSFPIAVRVAELVATTPGASLDDTFGVFLRAHDAQLRYALWLNRLLFSAFAPDQRWNVLARFYGLPERTIERFYAMTMTRGDRARIVCGRPPRGMSVLRPFLGQVA